AAEKRISMIQDDLIGKVNESDLLLARVKLKALPETRDTTIKIEGFQKMDKIKSEAVQEFISSVPKGFLKNVRHIKFDPHKVSMGEDYGIEGPEAAHADISEGDIVLTGGSQGEKIPWLINDLLPHELAHLNDWNSTNLNSLDSMELLNSVYQRVQSPDRFKSSYVEHIHNEDKQQQTTYRMREYFAEI